MELSLLDRLTDHEPESSNEAQLSSWEESRMFKAALCRDLSVLLNTRRAAEDFSPVFAEATNSLLTFGVVDFTAFNLKNLPEQERVRRSMERAIRDFEPRLARVTVTVEPPDPLKPILRFQVAAVLRTGSAGEDVLFDATLRRDSRRFAVSGVNQ
jgi:type VI secretion system protein ImpF